MDEQLFDPITYALLLQKVNEEASKTTEVTIENCTLGEVIEEGRGAFTCCKIPNTDLVYLTGYVLNTTDTFATVDVLCTVPEAYRPSALRDIPIIALASSGAKPYKGSISTAGEFKQGFSASATGVYVSAIYKL